MKAYVNTATGTTVVNIQAADVVFSKKELEKLTTKFNREATAIEFTGGTTYCIVYKDPKGKFTNHRLRSSSLDELLEMYKCAWKGKEVPTRKCYFHQLN